jgi:hypothetical protein
MVTVPVTPVSAAPTPISPVVDGTSTPNLVYDFATSALAQAGRVPQQLTYLRLGGYAAAGDGGGALYRRSASEPTHDGKLRTADLTWWEIAEPDVTPEMFGAVGDGAELDTLAIQRWFAFGVAKGCRLNANGVYAVNETISPAGRFNLVCGPDFRLKFDKDGSYTRVKRSNGAGGFEDGDKSVAFDIRGCNQSSVAGRFWITCHVPSSMTLAQRANIPADLVAITSSASGSASEIAWDALVIQGFGHGFFQDTMAGASPNILPYTRMTVGFLFIQFCLQAMESGASGNGFDDLWINVIRIARCAGQNRIQATDFNVGSLFHLGLDHVAAMAGPLIAGAIGAGATVYASSQQTKAAQQGMQAQQNATNAAIAAQQQALAQTQANNQPFMQGGYAGLDALLQEFGLQPQSAASQPAQAAAPQPDFMAYGAQNANFDADRGYLTSENQRRISNLAGIAGIGQSAAAGVNAAGQNFANNVGNQYNTNANALAAGYGQIADARASGVNALAGGVQGVLSTLGSNNRRVTQPNPVLSAVPQFMAAPTNISGFRSAGMPQVSF